MSKIKYIHSFIINVDTRDTPFYVINACFGGNSLCRDRFNKLNQYSAFDWSEEADPIPELCNKPIEDLVNERAQELISKGSIGLQWSGGVDSTTILCALIKNGIKKEDLEIFYSLNSQIEFLSFFIWLQKNGYHLHKVKNFQKELGNAQTDILVNGWCADQLFGSIYFHEYPDQYYWSLEDFLQNGKPRLKEERAKEIAEIYRSVGKDLFDIDLNIAAELGWYGNFCLKWTWVSTYNNFFLHGYPKEKDTVCFFNTPEFQGWSLANFPKIKENNIYGKDASSYKKELKEYIYSVFPDRTYLETKTKNPSWGNELNRRQFAAAKRICYIQTEDELFQRPYPKDASDFNFLDDFKKQ